MGDGKVNNNAYQMGRSAAASLRLNLQHHVLTGRQGWLVHPAIHSHLSAAQSQDRTLQILDLAAGNGVFTNAIANAYPHVHVTALDITSSQYPPAWSYPKNSTWSTLNLLDTIPDDLVGKFDLVHLRFLLGATPDIHIDMMIPILHKLLRKDGWLQWTELTGTVVDQIMPDLKPKWRSESHTESPHPVIQLLRNPGRTIKAVEDVPRIPEMLTLAPHHLAEIEYVEPSFKIDLVKADCDIAVTAMVEWSNVAKASTADSEQSKWKGLDAAVRQMQEEAASGTMFGLMFAVTIGRKAE